MATVSNIFRKEYDMSSNFKRPPLEAIRSFCIMCQGGSFQSVNECTDTTCRFYQYRNDAALAKGRHSPVQACRAYCFENCLPDGEADAVKDCGGDAALLGPCPVFPFRMGKNPNRSKPLSDERRAALMEAGKKHRFQTGQKPPFNAPESTESQRDDL